MMIRMTEAKWLLATLAITVALSIAIPCATKAESAEKSSYDQAMEFYYAGKYEEAAKLLKEYVNDNADPKAYFRLGYSLYKLGRHEEANMYFEQSYLVTPAYTPTPELEKKHKRLDDVRPEGFYEGKITLPDLQVEPPLSVPEGMVAVEDPSTLAVPTQEEEAEPEPEEEAVPEEEMKPAETVTEPEAEEATEAEVEEEPVVEEPKPEKPAPEPVKPREPAQPVQPPVEVTEKQAIFAIFALLAVFMIPAIVIAFVFYAAHAFFLYRVADKTNVGTPILAIVPLVNAITLSQAAGKSIVFGIIIILFSVLSIAGPFGIPFVGQNSMAGMVLGIASGILPIIAWVLRAVLWMFVAGNLGKKKIIGLLTILPGIHLIIIGWFAFSRSDAGGLAAISADAADVPGVSGEPDLDLPDFPDDVGDMGGGDDTGDVGDMGGGDDTGDMGDMGELPDLDDMDFDDTDFK